MFMHIVFDFVVGMLQLEMNLTYKPTMALTFEQLFLLCKISKLHS